MPSLNDFRLVGPTFVADVPLRTSPKLLFVTINKPDDIRDATKQATIRRHARRGNGGSRTESQRSHAAKVILENKSNQSVVPYLSVLGEQQNQGDSAGCLSPEEMSLPAHDKLHDPFEHESSSLAFLKPLGAGRGHDPFARYPVEPNPRIVQLLDYVWQDGETTHRSMRAIRAMWITIAMSDSSAFHVILASACLLAQEFDQSAEETTESMNHYTISIHSVGKRLQHPVDGISDGIIGTILGFACHDTTVGNWPRWQLHMSGLQRIIQLRGGIESLQTSSILQVTIFWMDVAGSLVLDTIPRFSLPHCVTGNLGPHRSQRILAFADQWNADFPYLSDIIKGLGSLAQLAGYADDMMISNLLWQEEMFVALKVHTVAHELLSMPRYPVNTQVDVPSRGLIIRETLRLTSLLFISLLKDHCGVYPNGVPENKLRLARLLSTGGADWSSYMDLHLWALTVSALAEEGEREWHISEIAHTMTCLGLTAWDDALNTLKELAWIDEMLDTAAGTLGTEVAHSQATSVSMELRHF